MTTYLSSDHFPTASNLLSIELETILQKDFTGSFYAMLAKYQQILADNKQRQLWPGINKKLQTLFMCGKSVVLDGPMIGIPVSIRNSDYFQDTVRHLGRERSRIASIEWMATAWNMTFADTGLWMGKAFEPLTRETLAEKCEKDDSVMKAFNPESTRIGRNFFRDPPDPDLIQGITIPVLTQLWDLKDRPFSTSAEQFGGILTKANLEKETYIPYNKTGSIYLADFGKSVVSEMKGKDVYQLNYRWPALRPVYPMTRLVDEIVQIAEGIYLGQLIYATRHYSLGRLRLPFCPDLPEIPIGESYDPHHQHPLDFLRRHFSEPGKDQGGDVDYGYQNNGYFLMMDPAYAEKVYADDAFPQLRPRPGETGYTTLGYDKKPGRSPKRSPSMQRQWPEITDWANDWKLNDGLKKKFTTFIFEPSPKESDTEDIRQLLKEDESILQLLQRISTQISLQSKYDDHLVHFEKLNRLFRCGVAPVVENGLFKGQGSKGYNVRADGTEKRDYYGREEITCGFDYYHGA
ncbi:MAG: hypothetical protein KJ668_08555, partial [Proteobacteria bacterium]|nr:hypothetical protein [Pseudomonadota bacterium]